MQQQTEVGVGDVFVNVAFPVFHACLEVFRQQGNDCVNVCTLLLVGIDRVLTLERELGALQQPAHDAGVDRVFLRLGRLGGYTTDLAGFVDHLQEQACGISHTYAWGVHL